MREVVVHIVVPNAIVLGAGVWIGWMLRGIRMGESALTWNQGFTTGYRAARQESNRIFTEVERSQRRRLVN